MRQAVQKVGRAVERVDDPAIRVVRTLDLAALFHHEAIFRTALGELFEDCLLGAKVRLGDEIGRAFLGDLQGLRFAEIAAQAFGRLPGGVNHDGHDG